MFRVLLIANFGVGVCVCGYSLQCEVHKFYGGEVDATHACWSGFVLDYMAIQLSLL